MALKKLNSDKKKKLAIIISSAVILLAICIVILVSTLGAGETKPTKETEKSTDTETVILSSAETTVPPDTQPEPEPEPISYPEPSYSHGTAFSFTEKNMGNKPQFIDPLTGLASDRDLTKTRPVAIMINNIEHAMPQVGVSGADILYECLAEGGITRLLMVTRDYASLDTIGSIRSSREYYIDFAMNHDAVYVHAGGSDTAYSQIHSRAIDHLDGVRADSRTGKNVSNLVFYRDPERIKKFSYEHTMVTTGDLIVKGINTMGYRTETDSQDPITPIDWGWKVELSGNSASHIKVPYRSNRVSEYVYDAETERYMRYQFNHAEHIDAASGEQLGFENVLILRMDHRGTGDSYGHIVVTTVGSGEGWYATAGKYIPIKWSKETKDSEMVLTDTEGNPLIVNRGKTAINIADSGVYSSVSFN